MAKPGKVILYSAIIVLAVTGMSILIGSRLGVFEVTDEGFSRFYVVDSETGDYLNVSINLYYYKDGTLYRAGVPVNQTIEIPEKMYATINFTGKILTYPYHNQTILARATGSESDPANNTLVAMRRTTPENMVFKLIKVNDSIYGDYNETEANFQPNTPYHLVFEVNDTGYWVNRSFFASVGTVRPNATLPLAGIPTFESCWIGFDENITDVKVMFNFERSVYNVSDFFAFSCPLLQEGLLDVYFTTTATVPTDIFLYAGDITNFYSERVDLH